MSDKTAYAGDARPRHGGDLSPLETNGTCTNRQTGFRIVDTEIAANRAHSETKVFTH